MDIFQNQYLINNITNILNAGVLAFIISFLVTPWVARLARRFGALDLPKEKRIELGRGRERGIDTRHNSEAMPRWGGIAMFTAIFISLLVTNSLSFLPKGIILGIVIVFILGVIDDKFELDSKYQLLFQLVAAGVVVFTGTSITSFTILGNEISFNLFSATIDFFGYIYNFIFPADFLTILWILGLMNVINWVGGVDGLNPSISGIAGLTMLLFAVSSGNIPLAIIISIYVGSILGILPFNYNPAKIYPGGADYLCGFLLAIFAIIGSTRWSATLILLGLQIIDGILVVITRFKTNPELLKNPLSVLRISDNNHLHHRLIQSGYSRKTVMLIEVSLMLFLCMVAILLSDIRQDVTLIVTGLSLIFIIFTLVQFLRNRHQREIEIKKVAEENSPIKEDPNVKVETIYKENDEDEKFVY